MNLRTIPIPTIPTRNQKSTESNCNKYFYCFSFHEADKNYQFRKFCTYLNVNIKYHFLGYICLFSISCQIGQKRGVSYHICWLRCLKSKIFLTAVVYIHPKKFNRLTHGQTSDLSYKSSAFPFEVRISTA